MRDASQPPPRTASTGAASGPTSHRRPRRWVLALAGAALCTTAIAASARAAQPAVAKPAADPGRGRVVEVEVPAPSLAGNLMGSATTQRAAVYLPPGYDGIGDRRYPAVYILHGIFDTHEVWTGHFDVPGILDRLIAGGEIPETIAVMPTAVNPWGGGFYRDSPVSGRWASYIAEDLVGFVDGRFRTHAQAAGRAVVGHSMGGYGALHLSMERPGVFSVAWAMSPCCLEPAEDLGFGNEAWRTAYRFDNVDDPQTALENGDFYAVAALAVLTAFSPDPGNPPFHVDFPFELVRGELVVTEGDYDRYLDAFPMRRVTAARAALKGLRGLALDAGTGDQFLHIPANTVELSGRLAEQRIPHLLDLYDGDHRQEVSRRLEELILPWVLARLDR